MNCQRCKSDRIVDIQAKCSDCCYVQYKGVHREGYVPHDIGLDGGDNVNMKHCLECGQIQGEWPLPEPDTSEDEGWDQPYKEGDDG